MVQGDGSGAAATNSNKRPVFYGWWIVAAGGAVQWYTSAVFWRGFQVFFDAIIGTFGWSRGATAAAISLQRTESGLISPFVGTLIDRYGPRKVMAFGITVTGAAFILMGVVQTLWHFYLAVVLLTVGLSFGSFIVLVTTVGNWFKRRRGRALSLLMSASAIGGFTLPVLVFAIDAFGWRSVLIAVGVGFWIVGYPATFVMKRRPEDYGEVPDGQVYTAAAAAADASASRRVTSRETNINVRTALRMRFFWQLSLATSLGQLVSSTNLYHFSALKEFGINAALAGVVAGFVAGGDLVGRLLIGFIGDRFDKRRLLTASFAVQTLGILGLTLVNAEVLGVNLGPWAPTAVFLIGFGLGFGSSIPLRLAILADYFGRRSYGSILGITSSVSAVFGAVGPLFVGVVFDLTNNYRPPFAILCVLLAIAIPLTITLEPQGRVAAKVRQAASRRQIRARTATRKTVAGK